MPQPLDPEHLSIDELQHYGELGLVKGLDPDIAKDLELIVERRLESQHEDCPDCKAKDEELDADETHISDLERIATEFANILDEVFGYAPNQNWFSDAHERFRKTKMDFNDVMG